MYKIYSIGTQTEACWKWWQALAANLSTSRYVQHLVEYSAQGSLPTCCLSLLDLLLLCAAAMHQLLEQLLCLRHFHVLLLQQYYWSATTFASAITSCSVW